MATPICTKCGTEVADFMVNKRKQLVGKCPTCGKWGNLGTGEKATEAPRKEEASAEAKKTPNPEGDGAASPAPAGVSKRKRKPGGTGKARNVGGPVRRRVPLPKPYNPNGPAEQRSWFRHVADFFDTSI